MNTLVPLSPCTDDKVRFNAMLGHLENNLVNGTPDQEYTKLYQKYFTIHETPVRGKVYSFNEDAIRKAERNHGCFALMTNGIKDPVEALRIYRLKDHIEKSFGKLKERLSMRRMSVASEENFEGKLFVCLYHPHNLRHYSHIGDYNRVVKVP